MTSLSQSPRDRILWILANNDGKMERSRLRAHMAITSQNSLILMGVHVVDSAKTWPLEARQFSGVPRVGRRLFKGQDGAVVKCRGYKTETVVLLEYA